MKKYGVSYEKFPMAIPGLGSTDKLDTVWQMTLPIIVTESM